MDCTQYHKCRLPALAWLLAALLGLAGCQKSGQSAFAAEVDAFCGKIQEIDGNMNAIDGANATAPVQLVEQLTLLNTEFQNFSQLDFPAEYDYLEKLSDEAASYMAEALDAYSKAYDGLQFDQAMADYAGENYNRAYKRIRIIVQMLNGETPEDVIISTGEGG